MKSSWDFLNRYCLATIAVALVLSCTGCATILLLSAPSESIETQIDTKSLGEDVALGIGIPDNPAILKEHPSALVIAGQRHSYVVTDCLENVLKQMTQLTPSLLVLNPDPDGNGGDVKIKITGTTFTSQVKMMYRKDIAQLTPGELEVFPPGSISTFNHLSEKYPVRSFYFRGYLAPPTSNLESLRHHIQTQWKLQLEQLTPKNVTHSRAVEKAFSLPITVMIDVLTLPVQAVIIGPDIVSSHKSTSPAQTTKKAAP